MAGEPPVPGGALYVGGGLGIVLGHLLGSAAAFGGSFAAAVFAGVVLLAGWIMVFVAVANFGMEVWHRLHAPAAPP